MVALRSLVGLLLIGVIQCVFSIKKLYNFYNFNKAISSRILTPIVFPTAALSAYARLTALILLECLALSTSYITWSLGTWPEWRRRFSGAGQAAGEKCADNVGGVNIKTPELAENEGSLSLLRMRLRKNIPS